MQIGRFCRRSVTVASQDLALSKAARLMRQHHVGCLVVVTETTAGRKPVGILTDRDIVVSVVAKELDIRQLTVGDAMTNDLICAREADSVFDAVRRMRVSGVRRLPVIGDNGMLIGIVSIDDLFGAISDELNDIAQVMSEGYAREAFMRA